MNGKMSKKTAANRAKPGTGDHLAIGLRSFAHKYAVTAFRNTSYSELP